MLEQKQKIMAFIIQEIKKELETLEKIAKDAREGAISGELKPDGQFDTRAIEAGYLASAQAARAVDLKMELNQLLNLPLIEFPENSAIGPGALVMLDENSSKKASYFIVPTGGGRQVMLDENKKVLVISTASPLGSEMVGLRAGDFFEVTTLKVKKEFEVLSVN